MTPKKPTAKVDVPKGQSTAWQATAHARAKQITAELNVEHPGAYLRAKILTPRGLTVKAAAVELGVSRQSWSSVITGVTNLSPEMAWRIEKTWGVSMESLLKRQMAYDIARVRAEQAETK
jgi:addiction module HigA family antidote